MQKLHLEDLAVWAKQYGVDLPPADLERIGSLAAQYLERLHALRQLDLEGEPLLSPRWVPETEATP